MLKQNVIKPSFDFWPETRKSNKNFEEGMNLAHVRHFVDWCTSDQRLKGNTIYKDRIVGVSVRKACPSEMHRLVSMLIEV